MGSSFLVNSKKCFLYFYFVFCVFVVFKMPTLHSKINKSAKNVAHSNFLLYLCTAKVVFSI